MKFKLSFLISIFFCIYLHPFHIDNLHNVTFTASHPSPIAESLKNYFRPLHATFNGISVVTDAAALARLARDTLTYIDVCASKRPDIIDPCGMHQIISPEEVQRTLQFIVKTFEYDQTHGTHLLNDPRFLSANFDIVDWKADAVRASKHNLVLPDSGAIRVTNYAIFCVQGSVHKTKEYSCALYNLKNESARTKYTKQEIIAGVFEKTKNKKCVAPLVWLTRGGLEDALMQGTVMVTCADKMCKIFNVHKNNGIAYDKNVTDMKQQKRYWFFKEVSSCQRDNGITQQKIEGRKEVVFAGDVYNIGIGKLIALLYRNNVTEKPEIRLGILADMGGAFINNLYQLDLFSGIFTSREQWREQTAHLPCYAHAYILCKK